MTNIKKSNHRQIIDFAFKNNSNLQGGKLKALYQLIQKKGEKIETIATRFSEENSLKGLKALQISETEFIAIKRIGSENTFYPCCLKTYLLTAIN